MCFINLISTGLNLRRPAIGTEESRKCQSEKESVDEMQTQLNQQALVTLGTLRRGLAQLDTWVTREIAMNAAAGERA